MPLADEASSDLECKPKTEEEQKPVFGNSQATSF
jgi:hypothetical protein